MKADKIEELFCRRWTPMNADKFKNKKGTGSTTTLKAGRIIASLVDRIYFVLCGWGFIGVHRRPSAAESASIC